MLDDLTALVDPDVRGDPMSPLRWTCKRLRRLAEEMQSLNIQRADSDGEWNYAIAPSIPTIKAVES